MLVSFATVCVSGRWLFDLESFFGGGTTISRCAMCRVLIFNLGRSVSDAAYMKWARKQLPNEEDEEFDDFEEEAPADTGILEEPKQVCPHRLFGPVCL